MNKYNYPTTLFCGEGCLSEGAKYINNLHSSALSKKENNEKTSVLLVTDKNLTQLKMDQKVIEHFKASADITVFNEIHPNPIEEDVIAGAKVFTQNNCDYIIALGGGSPMDVAKGIAILASNSAPLAQYDDAIGGDKNVTTPIPPIYAIPTTAGTGSEVGRAGVIIIKNTNAKTIIFHPDLLPKVAILEPTLTTGLPAAITAATGIDAFIHCLEAYLAPGFHPMADGIAKEGMELIIKNLPTVYADGNNLEARSKMLIASSMGATAFQKGLGMIHAMAHPLSAECGTHHGLANAILAPSCINFLENSELNSDQRNRINFVNSLFSSLDSYNDKLSITLKNFFSKLGINFGLINHQVNKDQLDLLSQKAFLDVAHQTNMIPVTTDNFKKVFTSAFNDAFENTNTSKAKQS